MVESSTLAGYATLVGVAGVVYYLSRKDASKGRNKGNKVEKSTLERRASNVAAGAGQAIKSKANKVEAALADVVDGTTSQDGEKKSKKKPKAKKQAPAITKEIGSTNDTISKKGDVDDDTNNLEFARQLNSAQKGTVAPAKSASAAKQKSVKQSKVTNSQTNGPAAVQVASDGDDDLSPMNSPRLDATSSRNDVSDMLESPAAGPASLRITSPAQAAPKKEKKPAAAPEPVETKKQRQNRKKAEEKKVARQAEEEERRKLEEAQRRTARIAEGRAAKDGQAFLAANPPTKSAWTPSATNGNATSASTNNDLLDTFVEAPKPAPIVNGVKGIKPNNIGAIPSEEDQMRMAMADTEWQDVPAKKSKKTVAKLAGENAPPSDKKENVKPATDPVVEVDQQPKEIPAYKETDAPEEKEKAKQPKAQPVAQLTTPAFTTAEEWEVS